MARGTSKQTQIDVRFLITGSNAASNEHIRFKLVSWRTSSSMTSTGCKIMWQVCLGQRLHAALAADHITSEKVCMGVAHATDYHSLPMEHIGVTCGHRFELDDQVNEETASARRMESNVLLSEVIAMDSALIIELVVDKNASACVASSRCMEYGGEHGSF